MEWVVWGEYQLSNASNSSCSAQSPSISPLYELAPGENSQKEPASLSPEFVSNNIHPAELCFVDRLSLYEPSVHPMSVPCVIAVITQEMS